MASTNTGDTRKSTLLPLAVLEAPLTLLLPHLVLSTLVFSITQWLFFNTGLLYPFNHPWALQTQLTFQLYP